MYHKLSLRQETIKAQMLEQTQRQERMNQLMREGTPEAIAQVERMWQEDEDKHKQYQVQIDTELRLLNESKQQQNGLITDVLQSIDETTVLKRLGDYRQLYFYRKSKVIFDLTFLFANRYITDYHDRTKDQMLQAARSGKQNFVEGLQDGQANIEQALYLVSIGQGSLQELREDYEDYIRNHSLILWSSDHPRYASMENFCKTNNDIEQYQPFLKKMNDEELANLALTLIHQTDYLIEGFLKRLEKTFLEVGGAKERIQFLRRIKRMRYNNY